MLIQGSLHLPAEGWEGWEGWKGDHASHEGGGLGGVGEAQHNAPSLLFWSPDFFDHAVIGQQGISAPATAGPSPNGQMVGNENVLVAGEHGAKLIIA